VTSFFVPTGIEEIVTLYVSFLSKLDFDIEFSIQEIELSTDFGFVRTRSHGTIIPKGQTQTGAGGNRDPGVAGFCDLWIWLYLEPWLSLVAHPDRARHFSPTAVCTGLYMAVHFSASYVLDYMANCFCKWLFGFKRVRV